MGMIEGKPVSQAMQEMCHTIGVVAMSIVSMSLVVMGATYGVIRVWEAMFGGAFFGAR